MTAKRSPSSKVSTLDWSQEKMSLDNASSEQRSNNPPDIEALEPKDEFSLQPATDVPQPVKSSTFGLRTEDPHNPQNWSGIYKFMLTTLMSVITFWTTLASSVLSPGLPQAQNEFSTSHEIISFGTSCFIFGVGFGAFIWGPASEVYGRRYPLLLGFAFFAVFQIGVAAAQNLATIFVCRFLAGCLGTSSLAVVGGALADMWDPVSRGVAVTAFVTATMLGPIMGPIVGGFIANSNLGWRWTEWITVIITGFLEVLGLLLIPETFGPLLARKREGKGVEPDNTKAVFGDIVKKYILRPFLMTKEPIVFFVSLYLALVFAILFLYLSANPAAFGQQRHWNAEVVALPALSIVVGMMIGGTIIAWFSRSQAKRRMAKQGGIVPEDRLPLMIAGAVALPVGLFWFGWTSNVHWFVQTLAGIPMGLGLIIIFLQGINYIVDVYLIYANSALAFNIFLRSVAAATFPLFTTQMYERLGVNWASSLIGFLTIAMIPIPIALYFYGEKLRKKSKLAPV